MKVALALNLPDLSTPSGMRSHSVASKYPGAGWVPYFVEEMDKSGIVCLPACEAGTYQSYLIVEELNRRGFEMLGLGSLGGISFCMESKLYQPIYYDYLGAVRPLFKHVITFQNGTEHLKFPSYYKTLEVKPYGERKDLVLVMSNKFVEPNDTHASMNWTDGLATNLQPKRYEAIEYFQDKIDVFGKGWNMGWLPRPYLHLLDLIQRKPIKEVSDKLETISNYKYAICFENVMQPGYITEKIIDCFAAGVVPIYLGAPDIEKYIPKNAYIDMRGCRHFHDLECLLQDVSPGEWESIIQAGRDYLQTEIGKLHQYEAFGNYIANKVKKDLSI